MSRLVKCENGHFYDADKYAKCPNCSRGAGPKKDVVMEGGISTDLDDVKTVAMNIRGNIKSGRSVRIPKVSGRTVKPSNEILAKEEQRMRELQEKIKEHKDSLGEQVTLAKESYEIDNDKTVAVHVFENGIEPVVGWLVCVNGEEKGRDYRLIRGRNRIGRDSDMDVTIRKDQKVTREEHCSVVYDEKSNLTFLVPGNGTLTYYKGEMLRQPQQLCSGDAVEIGETKFISQDKKAGEKIEEGNTISVVISKGVEQVKVPKVEGETLEEAQKALKKAKLKVDSSRTYSSSVEEGKIISQSIASGKTVDKNTTVKVVISLGKEPEPEPVYRPSSSSSSSGSSSSGRKSYRRSGSSSSSSRKSSGSKKKSSGGGDSINNWNLVN